MNPPSAVVGSAHRFARNCYSARHGSEAAALEHLPMPAVAAQALADLLPILLCGEESAELVFGNAAATANLPTDLRILLESVAADERRHGCDLALLRARLPTPGDRGSARRAAHFLRGLASPQLEVQLTRVAALDAGVCRVLAAVCARNTPIMRTPDVLRLFKRIRGDEGRHVRIGRHCAARLGIQPIQEHAERGWVLAAFVVLLARSSRALEALGVDPQRLFAKLDRLGAARSPITAVGL